MALLNPPQILPGVARVLFRALQGADGFAMPRAELTNLSTLISPSTLATDGSAIITSGPWSGI